MPKALIYAEKEFTVGQQTTVESQSPSNSYSVVFEDDGETGYLMGLDKKRKENPILDGLHIYNVENITDKHIPSTVKIVWSGDCKKALLLINDFTHAAFDFKQKRGYCRNNFPPPTQTWTEYSHEWDDSVLELFK